MIPLRRINDDVHYARTDIVRFGAEEIRFVKHQAFASARGRARICAHRDPTDEIHEMLIALAQRGYVRPHRHEGRMESFHVVEGAADVVIFDDDGGVDQVIRLDLGDHGARFYRLGSPRFHTVLVRTDCFVVHEVTSGPFDPHGTAFAPWSPEDADSVGIAEFLADVERRLPAR